MKNNEMLKLAIAVEIIICSVIMLTVKISISTAVFLLSTAIFILSVCFKILKIKHMEEMEAINSLKKQCVYELHHLETLLDQLPYLTDRDKHMITSEYKSELFFCKDKIDYFHLLRSIKLRVDAAEESVHVYRNYKTRKKAEHRGNVNYRTFSNTSTEIVNSLKVLGLSTETKDFGIIKNQYRILMLKYHPDRNRNLNAEEKAKEINAAYDTLEHAFA